jgi:hypothetical protein
MDGETIRLIVVALGAIAAALLAQIVAGAFNSRNTIATIEAARLAAEARREADRDVEHDRWLRDRKIEVYSKFLEEVHDLELFMADVAVGTSKDAEGLLKKTRNLPLLQMRVLAPKRVQQAAEDVTMSMTATVIELIGIKTRSSDDEEAYKNARKDFEKKLELLEQWISEDLGIEGTA